ncbi:MAG: zf-HC2 domain-containing protein [Chloroflexota bacterium]
MTCQHEMADLLPFYAAGTLADEERWAVERHLAECDECREELALWTGVGASVVGADAAVPAPSPAVLEATLRRLDQEQPSLLSRAWQLLQAQVPLVRREIWLASAMVLGLGYVVAILVGQDGRASGVIGVLAPLVAAAGVAMIYGAENDPALELTMATPTSPRQVLLARLVLVFGYDLALSLLATVGLVAVLPVAPLGTIILGWLGPMTFLSALALVLSLAIGTGSAITIALVLWMARWLGRGFDAPTTTGAMAPEWAQMLARAYGGAWDSTLLLLGLAAVMVAVAVWLAGRQETLLRDFARAS